MSPQKGVHVQPEKTWQPGIILSAAMEELFHKLKEAFPYKRETISLSKENKQIQFGHVYIMVNPEDGCYVVRFRFICNGLGREYQHVQYFKTIGDVISDCIMLF